MTQPGIRKRKDGTWEVTGSNDRILTQTQADYEDLLKASKLITGEQGAQVRKLLKNNPGASAGMIAGLAKYGAVPDNQLTKTLVDIDRATQAQRETNAFLEAQRISNEKFKNSFPGRFWTVAKSLVRGLSILPETGAQLLGAGARDFKRGLDAKMAGELTWFTEQPTDPNKTIDQVLGREDASTFVSRAEDIFKQTTLFNIVKDAIDNKKIDLGEGFFPSEEVGQGFKARQAQLAAYKVAIKLDNGEVYYRPYSTFDPIIEALPFVEPEDTVGTVMSALGDLLIMLRTDPGIAYSRIRTAQKEAERAARVSKGLQTSKLMKEKALKDIELEEAVKKTNEALEELNKATGFKKFVKGEEFQKAFDAQVKIADEYDNMVYDVNAVAGFLGSKAAEPLIDAIANIDNWQDIYALGKKGKKRAGLTVEQSKVLAAAKSRDEVLAAIAPYIAGGNVAADVLETGTKVGKAISGVATKVANSRIVPGVVPTLARTIKGTAAKVYRKIPYVSDVVKTLSTKYNTILPSGTFVHAADKDTLVDMVYSYGRAAKLDEAEIRSIADVVAFADDASQAGYSASGKLFNAIFARHADRIGVDKEKLEEVTRLFEGGREKMSMYWAERHASGAKLDYVLGPKGKKYTITGPHLDSEFLNSMIYFPPAEDLLRTISTFNKLNLRGIIDAGDFLTSNLWKKMVLVRPAYIIRNIAEEQIRVVGTGHVSFFNNPFTAMAMWLGRDGGPAWRKLLNQFDPFRHTIMGTNFKLGSAAEEFAAEVLAHDAKYSYLTFQSTGTATSIDRDVRTAVKFAGFNRVDFGHSRWWEGLASEIRILSSSLAGRVVARTGPGGEKAAVDFVLRGGGKDEWKQFANMQSNKEVREWLLTDEGAMNYLFTGKSISSSGREVLTSVRARVEEATGQGGEAAQALKNLIAYGKIDKDGLAISIPKGINGAENSIKNAQQVSASKKQLKDINEEFADVLRNAFNGKGDWEGLSMMVPTAKFGRKETADRGIVNGLVDGFFNAAIRFEKTSTMGPEWRQKYWDAIYDISSALDEAAVAKLSVVAKDSLSPLRSWKGEPVGQQHKVWKAFERTKPGGNISAEEAHEYASMVASNHVAELFYDASKKRLLFHQLRLIAPFGQAWEDTIKAWSKIALNNPAQIYKGMRPLSWLNNPESSALYQLTDARDYYDPNQGFFFRDPLDGQRKFFIPFASTGLNFLTNIISGQGATTRGPYAIGATPQSFNFAFASGSIIPGVGPGLSIGLQVLDKYTGKNPLNLLSKDMRMAAYNIVYPFGEPDLKNGFIFANLPGNWRRMLAPLWSEEAYASAFAPTMNYLATGGNYDLMDPEDQARLIDDTNKFSMYFTMMRGLVGLVSPFPFLTAGVTTLEDGNTLLSTELYNKFKEIEVRTADRNQAYAEFFNVFGPETVFAIINTSTGAPTNLYTYELIMDDPTVVDDYPNVYGYIYPNGGYSAELYRWQRKFGNKEKLPPEDLKNRAVSLLYYAAKDRLLTRATAEGWPTEQYDEANANLKQAFIGARLTQEGDFYKEAKIKDELVKLANDSRFDNSDAVKGLRDYLYLRQAALQKAGIESDNLARKDALNSRIWLAGEAEKIIERHPDFYKLFYAFFKKELEG